jgi:DNA-binding NarL/FixJ family response regulator
MLDLKRLTPRQIECVEYLVTGVSNKVIAAKTGLSLQTVRTYLCDIYKRLGVEGRFQIVAMYHQSITERYRDNFNG